MSVFRVKWERAGGHVHCTVFLAKHPNQTYANAGTFCVSEGEEFESLRASWSGAEFVEKQIFRDERDYSR